MLMYVGILGMLIGVLLWYFDTYCRMNCWYLFLFPFHGMFVAIEFVNGPYYFGLFVYVYLVFKES